jgi:hypothetical protein
MGKIDEILMPDEKVIKSQRRIQVGSGTFGMPSGDLFLTNKRILFIHSKGWSLLSPAAGSSLFGKNLQISLHDIQSVKKGFGSVKIKADKEYSFMVSAWKSGGWENAIQLAINSLSQPPTNVQPASETSSSPIAKEAQEYEKKEIIRMKEVIVKIRCPYCQSLYDETLDVCPRCGAKR